MVRDEKLEVISLWQYPIDIRIGTGQTETIDGPQEALTYLMTRWPGKRGRQYEQALNACSSALTDHRWHDQAREAFAAAAIEVHILA